MSDFLQNFLSHDAGPIAQFVKYALVGGIATAVNIAVFYLVGWRLLPSLTQNDVVAKVVARFTGWKAVVADEAKRARNAVIGNLIAFVFSNAVCYILNRLFVFEPGRHGVILEALLFFGISAVSIGIGSFIQTRLIKAFGMQTTYAFCANLVTSLAINFVMRKYVVFVG